MISENSETTNPYRLMLNPFDKIDSKRSDKYIPLSNLSINYTWKDMKK